MQDKVQDVAAVPVEISFTANQSNLQRDYGHILHFVLLQ